MLDEAVRLVLPGARVVVHVEREAYAAAVLAARMADGSLDEAPIWASLSDFDGRPWRGLVDIVTASPPCQPYSVAGKREGNTDRRSWGDGDGPIPNMLRIIEECCPSLLFFENVPAWVTGGWFRPVGDELSRMGYEIEEPVFLAASDIGAAHERERVFVLAIAPGERGKQIANGCRQGLAVPELCVDQMADTRHGQLQEPGRGPEGRDGTGSASETVAHTRGAELAGRTQQPNTQCATAPGGCGSIFAPGPSDPRWADILKDTPWLAPAIEPGLRQSFAGQSVVVDACRADQLRATGNQVCALQAAVAFADLLRRV